MGAHNAKNRHFQVEALEERLALSGTTSTVAITVAVSNKSDVPAIRVTTGGSNNATGTFGVTGDTSTTVTLLLHPVVVQLPLIPPATVNVVPLVPPVPPVIIAPLKL